MVVPRDWNFVRSQHYPEQITGTAIPNATGIRFKVGGFCLVISWFTILFSLYHSISHYKPRHRGIFNRALGFVSAIPLRLVLIISVLAALIAYQIFISFVWDFSIVKARDGNIPAIMAWGYGPSIIIMYTQIVYGFVAPNEDKELIRQRRERGEIDDRDLGIVRKPAWWNRVRGDHLRSMRDKINQNVNEVGGKRGVGRRTEDDMERHVRLEAERSAVNDDGIELGSMRTASSNPRADRAGARTVGSSNAASSDPFAHRYLGKDERRHADRIMQGASDVLFPSEAAAERARRATLLMEDGPPPPYPREDRRHRSGAQRPGSAHRSNSASTTQSIDAQPQQVRSMLDV